MGNGEWGIEEVFLTEKQLKLRKILPKARFILNSQFSIPIFVPLLVPFGKQ